MIKKMKIAFVYDAVYPYIKGGGEKRIYEISRRLVRRGHEVHLFGIKWWEGSDVIEREGVFIHGVCSVKGLYKGEKRSIGEALYFGAMVLRPLMRERFDVIDAGNFPYFPSFSCKIASIIKKTPLVITWHEVWEDYWYEYLGRKGFFGRVIERLSARLPISHIAVSSLTKNGLRSIGVPEDKITVIPNGIDFEYIRKISKSEEACDVLFAGRLIKDKNVDVLIDSISKMKNTTLCIIGDGPEKERLAARAEGLNLGGRIQFLGSMDYEEVMARMKSAGVFVLPSTREGFGIVLLEAMAAGLSVISVKAKKSAASEIVDGDNGILCEMNELKENIEKVLGDEGLREGRISKGFETARGFDWDMVTDLAVKHLESLT